MLKHYPSMLSGGGSKGTDKPDHCEAMEIVLLGDQPAHEAFWACKVVHPIVIRLALPPEAVVLTDIETSSSSRSRS